MGVRDSLTLPEAADRLGVHRATVNAMVLDGRIPAERIGSQWVISITDFEDFQASYRRPKHSTRRRATAGADARIGDLLRTLSDWNEATVGELAMVIDLHDGNIRKYLCLAEAQGLAVRNDYGSWTLTTTGRESVQRFTPTNRADSAAPVEERRVSGSS